MRINAILRGIRGVCLAAWLAPVAGWAQVIDLDDTRLPGRTGAPLVIPSNVSLSGGMLFETRSDPDAFTGDVVARTISKSGRVNADATRDVDGDGVDEVVTDNAAWRAHEQLPGWNERIIFTGPRPFRWEHLSDVQRSLLDSTSDAGAGSSGDRLVNWLRGDPAHERGRAGNLRSRVVENHAGARVHQPLGDMGRSSPSYIGPPSGLFADPDYSAFRAAHRNRVPALAVGANDGMVHFFSADDGRELFAYLPESLLPRLKHLADVGYDRDDFVDGSPVIADARGDFPACPGLDPCWRSVAVGGLGRGGRGIYALDVTDPEPATETAAARNMLLWEVGNTSAGFSDLGFTLGRPVITRLFNGAWVALFGNGVRERGGGRAALFVVNIADGALLRKIQVGRAPGGLLSPAVLDLDFDGDADFVYAGDTAGNLWKFDFTRGDRDGNPTPRVALGGNPLARVTGTDAEDDPVTLSIQTPPLATPTSDGRVIVIFGTGRLFSAADLVDHDDGLFGIFDPLHAPRFNGHGTYPEDFSLDIQTLAGRAGDDLRTLGTPAASSESVGWRLEFAPGERVLNPLILSDGRVVFTTVNPLADGHDNWIIGVDYETGGTPPPFLDADDDGDVDGGDLVGGAVPVSLRLGPGVASAVRVADIEHGLGVNLVTRARLPAAAPPGRFDLDTFNAADTHTCYSVRDGQGRSWTGTCHTRGYGGAWDVNGVNMLETGTGALADPPRVASADGILSSRHKSLRESMTLHGIDDDVSVYVEIINPWSVDTPELARQRAARSDDSGAVAPHATFFFQCRGGTPHELPAPAFNTGALNAGFPDALNRAQRTCDAGEITGLWIRFNDVNALRATAPGCVRDNAPGPVPGDPGVGRNTAYRNGAITVQVRRSADDAVIYESVSYRNAGAGATCAAANAHLFAGGDTDSPGGEPLRPGSDGGGDDEGHDDGGGGGNGGGNVVDGGNGGNGAPRIQPLGETVTRRLIVTGGRVSSGRVSWREVIGDE